MNEAEYVLCKWRKRLWPAKQKDLQLWARVLCEDVELLKEDSIERIAAQLGPSEECRDKVEELTHRRVLREALDYLRQATPCEERSPSKMGRSKSATRKEAKEQSLSPRVAGRRQPPSQNDIMQRRGKTREALAAPHIVGPQHKPSRLSREKAEGSSSAKSPVSTSRAPLGNRELEGRSLRESKTETPSRLKKDVSLKSLSGPTAIRRSPRLSKGDERRRQCKPGPERSSPLSPSKCFARISTPARPSHGCTTLTPGKKRSGKPGLRRNLLGSPVGGPPTEAVKELSEEEEFPPRKYSKDLGGQRRQPQESKGTCQGQTPMATSLTWERRCRREGSPGIPDPAGPILDDTQEEGPCPCTENVPLCDLEGNGLESSSEPALRLSPINESCLSSAFGDEEEAEEELPSILLHQEPCSMEAGMLVWCKLPRYPYWPAVVKSVKRKAKKAIVHLIDKSMDDKKSKGFSFSLRKLKHFDCEEKQMLTDQARESYRDEINWCINLIADYRIRVGCHSFTGTFLEYCADDMSYPVRKETRLNLSQMTFPQISEVDAEAPLSEATPTKPTKKVLPDRMRAARDKANEKIVEFIVKSRGAEQHLRAILKSKKHSRWLKEFLNAPPHLTCIETYLEDDVQQDLVVKYLEEVYREVDDELPPLINGDRVKFILDVLFPEAIIYAISAVDRIDYKKAEEKYIRGPLLSQREREKFEEEILEKKRKQPLQQPTSSPEEAL
uniref:PWWP domain-containing DNA repair factor 3A n=1 Tax=Euleptes europaea TaxID=460621 RepID=UPI00254247E5|nr:PWWP domain-containing DNA repair factor 3A [Euleptes europaea]